MSVVSRIRQSIKSSAKNVSDAFKRFTGIHEKKSRSALVKISLEVQRQSLEITPLRFGPLRESSYTDVETTNRGPVVRIGNSAEYASYVHEMPDHNEWTTPGTGPKYLSRVIEKNKDFILKQLVNELKI